MNWIDAPIGGRLAIAARPRAGDWLDDEILGWRRESVDDVVSLLEPHEIHDLELGAERDVCEKAGITFTSFPIVDRGVPASLTKTLELVAYCKDRLSMDKGVLVHCRAGIGRSATVAACVLVSLGEHPDRAFARIAAARGLPVPDTQVQVDWVEMFARA